MELAPTWGLQVVCLRPTAALCVGQISPSHTHPEQVTEFLHAGARQFGFMLRGLRELQPKLEALGIPFFLLQGEAGACRGAALCMLRCNTRCAGCMALCYGRRDDTSRWRPC